MRKNQSSLTAMGIAVVRAFEIASRHQHNGLEVGLKTRFLIMFHFSRLHFAVARDDGLQLIHHLLHFDN
jgi:hypothetical protein